MTSRPATRDCAATGPTAATPRRSGPGRALPYLAPGGSITLLGAITARAAMPGTAGIAAINGAVEALVKPLAAELGPIRVNGVSPGLVDTPWRDGLPEDARRSYFTQAAQQLPARRIATAESVLHTADSVRPRLAFSRKVTCTQNIRC